MRFRRVLVGVVSAAVAWGGFVLADQPAAYAICNDPCGGGGGYDPAVHAFVDLTVQGKNTTTTVGSVTGGHLSSSCTSSCTDSWSDTLSTEEDSVTYTATPASGWSVDSWTGCSSGGGTTTSCTVTPAYTTSLTKTSDNTTAVAVYFRDATAPKVTITGGPAQNSYITSSSTALAFTVDGTGTPATSRCAVDGAAFTQCTSPWNTGMMADGARTVTIRAVDAAGNTTDVSRSFVVDTSWPTESINSGPAGASYVNTTTADFTYSAADANFDHADCGDAATDSSNITFNHPDCVTPFFTTSQHLSGLPEGVHTFAIRAYDKAGHFSQLSRWWYIDTIAPTATFTGGPSEGTTTSETKPTFNFTPDGTGSTATTTCTLTGPVQVAESACTTNSSETLPTLSDGAYTLTLNLTDQAGNTASVARHFSVDTSIPTLTITSGPSAGGYVGATSATFTFAAGNGATSVSCSYDGEIQRPCSGGMTSDALTGMADGAHTWTARAVNSAASAITVTRTFNVDTAAPTAAFTSGLADGVRTNETSPLFAWTADGTGSPVTTTCSLDSATVDCTTPTTEQLSSLPEGQHTFAVHVVDATGHPVDISRTFTIDLTGPNVQVSNGPQNGDVVSTPDVTYFFSSEVGTAFACSLDGADPGPCAGTGSDSLTGLGDGTHTWQVQGTDAAGNVTTVTRLFTVDTAAPTAAFTSGIPDQGFTNDTTPEFDFAVDGTGSVATATCSIDSGVAAPCTSASSYVTPALSQAQHTAHVVVTDGAGNTVTISRTFTVDTTAPTLSVLSGPAQNGAINQTDVTFGFSAENGTSVGCSLDDGAYGLCTGTGADTTTGLTQATHTWRVRATDPAGNHTVVSRTFTVDLTRPTVSVTTSWPMFSLSRTLTFAWSPSDSGSGVKSSDVQVQHATPAGGFGTWSAPTGWTATTAHKVSLRAALGNTYCVHVRVRDKAGNTTGWSSARCTALPLDERSLVYSAHWKKITGSGFYNRTASQTSTHNATLTSHTVQAKHISVLVTTCRGCGTIGVYRGSTLLKKLSLSATTTHRRVLLTAWSGSSVRSGAIRIKVLSASGHLVQIDGLAVTRR